MLAILNPSDFLVRKHTFIPNTSITDKYAFLAKTYSCFSEVDNGPPAYTSYNTHHNVSHSHKRNYKKKHSTPHSTPPPFLIPNKEKDPFRIILGLLNVINTDNYSKIFQKLRLLIDIKTIDKLVFNILDKCCIATIYVNVYIKLLEDISSLYNIKNIIGQWAESRKDHILLHTNPNDDEYDSFCKMQKHKLHVSGQTTTMIKLVKAELIDQSILEDYYKSVCEYLKTDISEDVLDIILNIIIDIGKSYKTITLESHNIISHLNQESLPIRLRFILEEIR